MYLNNKIANSSAIISLSEQSQRSCLVDMPVSRIEFAGIELAITSVSSLLPNQLVESELQRARDHGQRAVMTPRVTLSFSFLSRFSVGLH